MCTGNSSMPSWLTYRSTSYPRNRREHELQVAIFDDRGWARRLCAKRRQYFLHNYMWVGAGCTEIVRRFHRAIQPALWITRRECIPQPESNANNQPKVRWRSAAHRLSVEVQKQRSCEHWLRGVLKSLRRCGLQEALLVSISEWRPSLFSCL